MYRNEVEATVPESRVKYDEETAKATECAYLTPEITQQRMATLKSLALRPGESVLDVGVGPGLLAHDMAQLVENSGRVIGIDNAPAMIEIARNRCSHLDQVEIRSGDAVTLDFPDGYFDAVACTQVLLYVSQVIQALAELYRVLKPGGRAVIVETDWRGLVLNSGFPETTEKMIQSWDAEVASPNLPTVLQPMLKQAGFKAISVSAIPVVTFSCTKGNFAHSMLRQFSGYAVKQGRATESEARIWVEDLHQKHEAGTFFYCINRFLFTAFRV